jgi:FixJ family two-component response regulator
MGEHSRWIAVVDDDPSVLKALRRALGVRAFHCKTYSSAPEFLASLSGELPACLIADLQMPEMTGLELHHHLTRADIHIPTIIIAVHTEIRIREQAESAGVIAILTKPFQNASLFAAIATAIKAQRDPDAEPSDV